ncbi:MAG: hypothetical protein ABI895_10680 [Deltaproteobacteria bacterium]
MPRWYLFLSTIVLPAVVFACNDDTIQDVPQDVCYSGKQWIGGKRGDPRMYPGRDCVGCHIDNDGPELMVGGTIYPYVDGDFLRVMLTPPTGDDCFGEPNQTIEITGGDGQIFEAVTNEAGNFFIEGKATDLIKPFSAVLKWTGQDGAILEAPMSRRPDYGGCGRCHARDAKGLAGEGEKEEDFPEDERVFPAGSPIGMRGNLDLMKAP